MRQSRHDARLSERLDDQHAGHDGIAGKVAGEPPVVGADEPAGVAALARDELDDLVEQQERRAVGDELFDLGTGEGDRGAHAFTSPSPGLWAYLRCRPMTTAASARP